MKSRQEIFEILKEIKAGEPIAPRLYILLVLQENYANMCVKKTIKQKDLEIKYWKQKV